MEELIELGHELVQAMRNLRGIAHVDETYAENAQSVMDPPPRTGSFCRNC